LLHFRFEGVYDHVGLLVLAIIFPSLAAFLLGLLFHFQFWVSAALYTLTALLFGWFAESHLERRGADAMVMALVCLSVMLAFSIGFQWATARCTLFPTAGLP
jgi:hypothetical protein